MSAPPAAARARKKKNIPQGLRHQVWLKSCGKAFTRKCSVRWCTNEMDPFNFECGHNIPESKAGPTTLENLHAICGGCNKSMGDRYSIDEWNQLEGRAQSGCFCI